jgi:hypothetical protein
MPETYQENRTMTRWTLCAGVLLLCGVTSQVYGNGAPFPRPQPAIRIGAQEAKIAVEIDEKAKVARLQIPAQMLIGVKGRPGAGAGLDRVPMVIAGLALTCALVSGGFWLVRRGNGNYLASIGLGLSLLVLGTSAALADLGPRPPKPLPTIPVKLPTNIEINGNLIMEVTLGDTIKLIVNKNMVKEAKAEAAPEEKSSK